MGQTTSNGVCSKKLDLAVAAPLYFRLCLAGFLHFILLGKAALAQGAATDCSK